MRFKRRVKLEYGMGHIVIAPFINIFFLLLIFFALSSPFASSSGVGIALPKTVTSELIKEENLGITITGEDVTYLNGRVVTFKELRSILGKSRHKDTSVLIKADRRASLGRIIDIWDLCRDLGIEKINIATNQEK